MIDRPIHPPGDSILLLDGVRVCCRRTRCWPARRTSAAPGARLTSEGCIADSVVMKQAVLTHPSLPVVDEIGYLRISHNGTVLFF